MRAALDALENFFARFIPGPLKRPYFLAVRYATFVFGGLIGWLIVIVTEQAMLRLGLWRGIGYGFGIALAVLFTFFYHRYVTFGVKSDWKQRLTRFAPIQVAIAAANWVLFIIATDYLHFSDVATSFVITFFLSLINFALSRLLVFHRH